MKSPETKLQHEGITFAKRINRVPRSGIREILANSIGNNIISFGGGVPHQTCIPTQKMIAATDTVLSKYSADAFTYGSTEGEIQLRSYIADVWLKRIGIDASPSEIIIVNGSQQALDLLGKLFIDTDSPLLVERPAYLAALQAFSVFEPQFHEVHLDSNGPLPDMMRNLVSQNNYRFFYTCPTFQNPTGISYSRERRIEIAEILNQYNVLCIEDDPYSQLFYESTPPEPLCSHGLNNGIYLGTFSKIIAPGFRLGWIWAKPHIIKHLITLKQASDLCTGRFQQLLLYETLMSMDCDEHLSKNRSFYTTRRDRFDKVMDKYLKGKLSWQRPAGGMFFWAETCTGTGADLLRRCLENGVAFADGNAFFALHSPGNKLRLNFTQVSEFQMDQGLKIIGELA